MKKVTIWKRTILERRQKGFFQPITEWIAKKGKKWIEGSQEDLENKRLKIQWRIALETSKKKDLIAFWKIQSRRSDEGKEARSICERIAREEGIELE